jgi:putative CocE/NonD family hydrolase
MNGAISRYLTKKDNPRHLLLGPWDHGARIDISPWRRAVEPDFPLLGEVLRFFDTYLMGLDTGLRDEEPIHYFAVHAEEWRAAQSWPPIETPTRFFLASENRLANVAPRAGEDEYRVDFTIGTGADTRYERIAGIDSRDYYADWQGRTAKMLSYTSEPLTAAAELAGHGLADLWLSGSERDLALFVYLTEVEAGGGERYVTEGLLRALHRRERPRPRAIARHGRSAALRVPMPRRWCRARSSVSAFRCCRWRGSFRPAAASASLSRAPMTTIAGRSRMAGRRC